MDKVIKLDISKTLGFINQADINNQAALAKKCNEALHGGSGKGNDFLGWLNLPSSITDAELKDIEDTAKALQAKCEVVVLVGIGGSYLGSRAVIDSLSNAFDWLQRDRKTPVILYAGNNIGEDYLVELLAYLKGKSFGIINISKSGTTTEPALAFRILKAELEKTVGKDEAKHRIVAITDAARGALFTLATKEGFKKYIISGCLSSLIGLALGTQTILNVMIAMQFRLIVGLILWMCHNHMIGIMISGPIASALARLTLSVYIGKAALPMVALAVPGMIFTVIMAPVFVKVFRKIHSQVPQNDLVKGKVS